jgi:glycosyltransferase involved in cell wall biosynthesis
LNILAVADVSIAQVIGGAERVLYEQSTRLAQRGHSVDILTRKLPWHDSDMAVIQGVREWRFAFPSFNLSAFLKSTFFDCRHLFGHLHEKFSFNVLNFHQPYTALGVLSSKKVRAIPRVYTCHSLSFEEFASRSSSPHNTKEWIFYRLQLFGRKLTETALLGKSNRIVVLSKYTRDKILREYGFTESKVEIIPGAVSLARFRVPENKSTIRRRIGIPENCFVLLTIRNLVPRMGLENLIIALKLLVEQRKDILLTLGGEGPLAEKLQDMARDAGVANFVRFTGFIPEKELPSYYQMADLFILPTKDLEGFGMVTVEALASGLPVLGTPVGGTKEILTHLGPEFLFADSNPVSIANLILKTRNKWDEDPKGYNEISQKCRHIAEHYYSWEAHIDRLEGLFQQIAHSASKTGKAKQKPRHP